MRHKFRTRIPLRKKTSISNFTGMNYTPKMVKKLFESKEVDLVIFNEGIMPKKIGKVKNITYLVKKNKILINGELKTSVGVNIENKSIHFGTLHVTKVNMSDVKFKDIRKSYFYITDKTLEKLLLKAADYDMNLTPRGQDGIVKNSCTCFEDLFVTKNKKFNLSLSNTVGSLNDEKTEIKGENNE